MVCKHFQLFPSCQLQNTRSRNLKYAARHTIGGNHGEHRCNGVFTLPDSETDSDCEKEKKSLVQDFLEVFNNAQGLSQILIGF